jgi:hypothetical protein
MKIPIFSRVVLFTFLLVGAIVLSAIGFLYHTKEFHAARSIAQEYATQKHLVSDLTCVKANRSWTKRGDLNLSWFLFLPKDNNSTCSILVRYTPSCPSNTFEVGEVTNLEARDCTVDTVIYDTKLISPTINGF